MRQMVIRTCFDANYSNIANLNEYLSNGWIVAMVNPIGKYLEYILQKSLATI